MSSDQTKLAIAQALSPILKDMVAVDNIIRDELDSDVPRIREMASYITSAGGKRLRPALLLLICRALGYEGTLHHHIGATIELLHTATLMHDDVVDESDMRRGRETSNAKWGNAAAILVGDFLYTRSFEMMIRAGNLRVMQTLAGAANRLAEGEVYQMCQAHDPEFKEENYFKVIERKTACLFEASACMAAAIAQTTPALERAVCDYALALGNAFQIVDDMLDYTGSADAIGKNLGDDLKEGKVTLPLLYARQLVSDKECELIDEAIRTGNGDFEKISNLVRQSGALNQCHERAIEEILRGKRALDALPPTQFKESLLKLLTFTVERQV